MLKIISFFFFYFHCCKAFYTSPGHCIPRHLWIGLEKSFLGKPSGMPAKTWDLQTQTIWSHHFLSFEQKAHDTLQSYIQPICIRLWRALDSLLPRLSGQSPGKQTTKKCQFVSVAYSKASTTYFAWEMNPSVWEKETSEVLKISLLFWTIFNSLWTKVPNAAYGQTKAHACPRKVAVGISYQVEIVRGRKATTRVAVNDCAWNGVAVQTDQFLKPTNPHECFKAKDERLLVLKPPTFQAFEPTFDHEIKATDEQENGLNEI